MPEKLHRCVDDLKAEGSDVDNPWAVCNASISEVDDIIKRNNNSLGQERSLAEIASDTSAPMAREKNGHFTNRSMNG